MGSLPTFKMLEVILPLRHNAFVFCEPARAPSEEMPFCYPKWFHSSFQIASRFDNRSCQTRREREMKYYDVHSWSLLVGVKRLTSKQNEPPNPITISRVASWKAAISSYCKFICFRKLCFKEKRWQSFFVGADYLLLQIFFFFLETKLCTWWPTLPAAQISGIKCHFGEIWSFGHVQLRPQILAPKGSLFGCSIVVFACFKRATAKLSHPIVKINFALHRNVRKG